MALWVLSFCIMAIEAWGSIYFFDTFLKKTDVGRLGKYRYVVLYFAGMVVALLGGHFDLMGIKVMLVILVSITFCTVFYEAGWKQRIFFSGLNYALLFLTDLFFLQIENMSISPNVVLTFLLLPSKMLWLCLVFIVRKIWKGQNNYGELSRKEWLKFSMIPLLTVASMLLMFFCSSTGNVLLYCQVSKNPVKTKGSANLVLRKNAVCIHITRGGSWREMLVSYEKILYIGQNWLYAESVTDSI